MNSFAVVALLCLAAVSANPATPTSAVPTTGGPTTTVAGNASAPLDPAAEKCICEDKALTAVCPAKGEADKVCQEIVAKINGSQAVCQDVGVCAFVAPNATATPTPSGTATPTTAGTTSTTTTTTTTPSTPTTAAAGGSPTTPAPVAPNTYYISSKPEVDGCLSVKHCESGVSILAPKPSKPASAGAV